MEYYYIPKENISSKSLLITGEEAEHLGKVLRKKEGEEIYVTDGDYNLYKVSIGRTSKDFIECDIIDHLRNVNEPSIKISLYQSLLKNPSRFDFVIEKAVEMGVYEIFPLITKNVINKETARIKRWQSIALSAMKQSQRCYLPRVHEPVNLKHVIEKMLTGNIKIIAHEKEGTGNLTLADITQEIKQAQEIALLIGPEGGFTDLEIVQAVQCGYRVLNLGKRKLRSETAAIAASGIILSLA